MIMADKTLRNKASLESKFSLAPFSSSTITPDPAGEDDATTPADEKGDFFRGFKRGIRRLGSVSHPTKNRPGDIDTTATNPHIATAIQELPEDDHPITAHNSQEILSSHIYTVVSQNQRDRSLSKSREKPLPLAPVSPPIEDLLKNPLDSAKVFTTNTMSRPGVGGSRTSTMDSTTSAPGTQLYAAGYKSGSQTYLADMNASHNGQQMKEGEDDTKDVLTPRSNGANSAGPSPAGQTPRTAGHTVGTPGGSSTHLSGLMCNVHRTTGQEPHPLVGATTTILGDKLYVFGGRVLSRTKPALTSNLYELDLIRRHWTKVDANGDIPPPRYFHSVCPLGDTKLVCYGGMSPAPNGGQTPPSATPGSDAQPEVVVMSDIYIYDAPTKTWSFVQTQETPQGRYAHCATILPSSATFSSINAASSAIQHNLPSSNPNQGTLGVNLDGTGGAEMIVVGGQDSANHYIEQISVFNLRSLKWTSTQQLGKSCGAYRSVVAPLPGNISPRVGRGPQKHDSGQETKEAGASMLIYSNYNFLDVKLELQIRGPDGTLSEKPMGGNFSPPGLRFPNGGVIDTNFVVSGTYLTSSKQEYALWALDLRTLTWSRIDAGGSVFSQGSWNRGILWNRRNTFVILGNRKRSLVEDYNHRRINFSNVCMVELEAFGLYDNPRKAAPMSGFVSASSPYTSPSLSLSSKVGWTAGGRSFSKAAESLGQSALSLREMADMDILCVFGERIPVNSRIVARRWGPYFVQLLREGAATQDGNDAATLRPDNIFKHNQSRNSSLTITPSIGGQSSSNMSTSSTLNNSSHHSVANGHAHGTLEPSLASQPPDALSLPPSSRPRTLYLPHTHLTLQALLHYLYTSSLPPSASPLCTPQILCSLLQLARPYKIDGLLEAVVERLHDVLDSRNAAAVFNASAMAAGGGRSTSSTSAGGENWLSTDFNDVPVNGPSNQLGGDLNSRNQPLRINTSTNLNRNNGYSTDEEDNMSTASSAASDVSGSDVSGSVGTDSRARNSKEGGEPWRGDISAVIGLQKRGLRGLMEGRRLRERGASVGPNQQGQQRVGLGIGAGGV